MERGRGITFVLLLLLAVTESKNFIIHNKCPYSVWLGSIPSIGLEDSDMFETLPGAVLLTEVRDGWRGRIYLRTRCKKTDDLFTCLTGNCRSGKESCEGLPARAPVTLIDFLNFSGNSSLYFYDVNLMHGFNVPVTIYPEGGPSPCKPVGCAADIIKLCPPELLVKDKSGVGIACQSACDKTQSPQDCCYGNFASREKCKPSPAASIFKKACPDSHSWTYDDRIESCAPADFNITVCP